MVTSSQQKDTEDEVREIIRSNLHLQGKVKMARVDHALDWDLIKVHFVLCLTRYDGKKCDQLNVWSSL